MGIFTLDEYSHSGEKIPSRVEFGLWKENIVTATNGFYLNVEVGFMIFLYNKVDPSIIDLCAVNVKAMINQGNFDQILRIFPYLEVVEMLPSFH